MQKSKNSKKTGTGLILYVTLCVTWEIGVFLVQYGVVSAFVTSFLQIFATGIYNNIKNDIPDPNQVSLTLP